MPEPNASGGFSLQDLQKMLTSLRLYSEIGKSGERNDHVSRCKGSSIGRRFCQAERMVKRTADRIGTYGRQKPGKSLPLQVQGSALRQERIDSSPVESRVI
jgi:hypothetical protein